MELTLIVKLATWIFKSVSLIGKCYLITSPCIIKVFYLYPMDLWAVQLYVAVFSHFFCTLAAFEWIYADFILFDWHFGNAALLKKVIASNPSLTGQDLEELKVQIEYKTLDRAIDNSQVLLPLACCGVVSFLLCFLLGKP